MQANWQKVKDVLPPKTNWANVPTPIEHLSRLSSEWGVDLHVKRDDLTGFALGGNKIRKLDYLVKQAIDNEASCLITCGGVQSNHCRAVAVLAAKLGLECILILRGEKPKTLNSNLLIDYLTKAEIVYVTDQEYEKRDELRRMVEGQVRSRGGKPFYIPEGGSNEFGVFGYIETWLEILQQSEPEPFDSVVFATGSGGTQAGLILGKLLSEDTKTNIFGVNVCYSKDRSFTLVKDILWQSVAKHKLPLSFLADDIQFLDGFIGDGYAISTKAELEFIAKVAATEGLILDPVYSGKAFYALYNTISSGTLGKRILFIHTGGAFGIFKVDWWHEVLLD